MTRPPKEHPAAPAQEIAPGVYCLRLPGMTQTNVYFVGSGGAWTLIDTGWAKDAASIEAAAASLFEADAPPVSIVLTHVHPDHAGSARRLARTWGCPVYVHPEELPIAEGDVAAMTASAGPLDRWLVLPLLRVMGQRRREAIIARSSLGGVARAFDPRTGIPGLPDWACIPTPGHTPGHVSFFRSTDRVLITGDAVVTLQLNAVMGLLLGRQGLSGPPRYTSWDWPAARASVATLATLEPDVLAGGHGTPLRGLGVAAALRAFADGSTAPKTADVETIDRATRRGD